MAKELKNWSVKLSTVIDGKTTIIGNYNSSNIESAVNKCAKLISLLDDPNSDDCVRIFRPKYEHIEIKRSDDAEFKWNVFFNGYLQCEKCERQAALIGFLRLGIKE